MESSELVSTMEINYLQYTAGGSFFSQRDWLIFFAIFKSLNLFGPLRHYTTLGSLESQRVHYKGN